jgi:hypothetical protein
MSASAMAVSDTEEPPPPPPKRQSSGANKLSEQNAGRKKEKASLGTSVEIPDMGLSTRRISPTRDPGMPRGWDLKKLSKISVIVDKKSITLGRRANYRFLWKNVKAVTFAPTLLQIEATTKDGAYQHRINFRGEPSKRGFHELVKECWDRQVKLNMKARAEEDKRRVVAALASAQRRLASSSSNNNNNERVLDRQAPPNQRGKLEDEPAKNVDRPGQGPGVASGGNERNGEVSGERNEVRGREMKMQGQGVGSGTNKQGQGRPGIARGGKEQGQGRPGVASGGNKQDQAHGVVSQRTNDRLERERKMLLNHPSTPANMRTPGYYEPDPGLFEMGDGPKRKIRALKRVPWSRLEIACLRNGVARRGVKPGRWAEIKNDFGYILRNRTNVQIKDGYRTWSRKLKWSFDTK